MVSPKLKTLLVLFLLLLGLSFQGWRLFPAIRQDLSQVRRSIGQPGLWRGANFGQGQRFANYLRFLHENIPPDARVVLPPAGPGPEALSTTPYMQFFLAPRQVINCTDSSCLGNLSPRNTYFLLVGPFPLGYANAPQGPVWMFDQDWGLVAPQDARPGAGQGLAGFQNLFQVLLSALGPVFWLSLLAAAGGFLVKALGVDCSPSFRLALGYGIGLLAFSLVIAAANLIGLPVNLALVLGTSAFLFLGGFGLLAWSGRRAGGRLSLPAARWPEWSRLDPWPLVFLAIGGLMAILAAGKGYHAADEVQIWGVKGAGIALTRSLSTVTQWGTNTLPYPLNIPILIAAARLLFGEILPASKLLFTGFYVGLALVSYHFLLQVGVRRAIAGLATLLLATAPLLVRHAALGFANLPLAYYLVCGVLLLALAIVEVGGGSRAGLVLLGGLCFAGAAWTRPEGLVMALAAMALLWVIAFLSHLKALSLRETLLLVLPLGLYAVIWQLIGLVAYSQGAAKSGLAGAALARFLAGDLHLPQAGYILRTLLASLLDPVTWGSLGMGLLIILAGLVIAVLLRQRARPAAFLVLACGLLITLIVMGTYFVASYDTVHDISWWLNSGLDRMALPAVALLWIGGIALLTFAGAERVPGPDP